MEIVETRRFTRSAVSLLSPEEYRALQNALIGDPELGEKIPGSGGLRKLRWAGHDRGKRGGFRLIYFWHGRSERLLMLFLFGKNERADLTASQLRALRKVVEEDYP